MESVHTFDIYSVPAFYLHPHICYHLTGLQGTENIYVEPLELSLRLPLTLVSWVPCANS